MHRRGELDALSSVGICWLLSPFPRQHDLSGLPVLRICGSPTKPASCLDPSVPAKHPQSGPGWVHELMHDGYRLLTAAAIALSAAVTAKPRIVPQGSKGLTAFTA